MATRGPDHGSRLPIPYRALAGFIVACAAFAAIFVALAVGAYHAPRPHNLPVGIVGSAPATSGIEHALDSALPGGDQLAQLPKRGRRHGPGSGSGRSTARWSRPARSPAGCSSPPAAAPLRPIS